MDMTTNDLLTAHQFICNSRIVAELQQTELFHTISNTQNNRQHTLVSSIFAEDGGEPEQP